MADLIKLRYQSLFKLFTFESVEQIRMIRREETIYRRVYELRVVNHCFAKLIELESDKDPSFPPG